MGPEFLRGTKKEVDYDLEETPLVVFINARSGGRVGPQLANKLAKALGRSQVQHKAVQVYVLRVGADRRTVNAAAMFAQVASLCFTASKVFIYI